MTSRAVQNVRLAALFFVLVLAEFSQNILFSAYCCKKTSMQHFLCVD